MKLNRRSFFATLMAAPAAVAVPAAIAAPARIATKATATELIRGIRAGELINRTLIQIGVLRPGEVGRLHDKEYALGFLNEIVASWPIAFGDRCLTLDSIIPLVYCQALRAMLAPGLFQTYFGYYTVTVTSNAQWASPTSDARRQARSAGVNSLD